MNRNKPGQRFRFEPGSYGAPGRFMPSIACLKETPSDQLQYHFILVKPAHVLQQEVAASKEARQDLEAAFGERGQQVPDTVATALKSLGYQSVDGFKIVDG
jgi:hypothetical protein